MIFHFLRSWWLLAFFLQGFLLWLLCRPSPVKNPWSKVCDRHLLAFLLQAKRDVRRGFFNGFLMLSLFFMIIALAGPSWTRMPQPSYQDKQARVVVLDMSQSMSANDLQPDRLSRAKFKLHDLFQHQGQGQFALVVYTAEPFVVSPLTDDGQTIDALLSSLTQDIMPVQGQHLSSALQEAATLIQQAGFHDGQILVLSGSAPSEEDIVTAKHLAQKGMVTSVLPVSGLPEDAAFAALAKAGQGHVMSFQDSSDDIEQWLSLSHRNGHYVSSENDDIPLWRDEGRWFLIPALLFLLPAFRRGSL
jgi:Ca-activated chloride channel family protein